MKIRIALPIALVLGAAFLPACSKSDAKEAKDAVENVAGEGIAKAGDALKSVTSGLKDITDLESAKKAAKDLLPSLETLKGLKDKVGDKMPDMSALGDAVQSLKDKFSGDQGILDALKPLFDKIKALLGQ